MQTTILLYCLLYAELDLLVKHWLFKKSRYSPNSKQIFTFGAPVVF